MLQLAAARAMHNTLLATTLRIPSADGCTPASLRYARHNRRAISPLSRCFTRGTNLLVTRVDQVEQGSYCDAT